MQIIIPMSGFGERFRRAGYSVPKPLIHIEGKPIIAHVIDMFPGETDFIFICNEEHLAEAAYQMEDTLRRYCPTGKIIGIPPHKLGPVYAVLEASSLIKENDPVIVNYCDFTCYWDWENFKEFASATQASGVIPAYKGFHPHTLGTTNYAYLQERNGWVKDIQEKQPYTSDRMNEFASSGTYYFASGALMKKAFSDILRENINVNGEYYVSLAYKPMLSDGLPVAVYPLQHFMQWGTPADVDEYNEWSKTFKRLIDNEADRPQISGSLVIPMAGLGARFAKEGYTLTKPLIPVSGRPMVLQAVHDLPNTKDLSFILRSDMDGVDKIISQIESAFPGALIATVPAVTDGQACTALIGLDKLARKAGGPITNVTFGACDNGVLFDQSAFLELCNDPSVDVIVWGVRKHTNAIRHPHMFGWIEEVDGKITSISVKKPLKAPEHDPIVIGTFTFRRSADFVNATQRLIGRDGRVNGEFYMDSCVNDAIASGLNCVMFEVDSFISWGTPNDLKTFEYWQSCFQKWPGHPYSLELDKRVPADQVEILKAKYAKSIPLVPNSPL
ncbi:NTP transferase domain-containing protein [Pseudomonas typographi]|uniref:NTP transferase domain-containing protein n=1 Tax=Pseudomonas typographi TaxID=2715964 RepID=UPI001685812C|nr:sugar phosphate nucleotidyltransferase [Pseudomonas typographi]MBD1553271.1 NTP transferase domain-containing protein [Pseudomonas typographi]